MLKYKQMNINRLQNAKTNQMLKRVNTQVNTRRNQVLTKAFRFSGQHYLYLSKLFDSNNSL